MKPHILVFFVLLVSLLFLNVWQSYRYGETLRVLRIMEDQQLDWVERNRRVLAAIAMLDTPERLDSLAQDELGLHQAESQEMMFIQLPGEDY
ncbi:MAG: hypothetical protein PF447_01365 [Spirochaetaceae bacterium]|jgi:beta-lactamase superfamily II metal-dependent hydrolase|nr:hypothetical protein [Spirochaetaceae bacterium]